MFVAGCHRSGTSYLTSLLSEILEYERSSDMEQTVDNPRGYFESTFLGPLNESLLSLSGCTWDRPPLTPVNWTQGKYLEVATQKKSEFAEYSLSDSWVDKDPRLSITFPFYKHILLKRTSLLIPIRDPAEVALSLHYRDGFPLGKGLLIWYLYNRHCSRNIDIETDQIFSYEGLISSSSSELRKLILFSEMSLKDLRCSRDNFNIEEHVINAHARTTSSNLRRSKNVDEEIFLSSDNSKKLYAFCSELYKDLEESSFDLSTYQNLFIDIPTFVVDTYDFIFSDGEPSLEYMRVNGKPENLITNSVALSSECETGQYDRDQMIIKTFADLIESFHQSERLISGHLEKQDQFEKKFSSYFSSDEDLDLELHRLNEEILNLKNSFFWKISYPMRALLDLLKSLKQKIV